MRDAARRQELDDLRQHISVLEVIESDLGPPVDEVGGWRKWFCPFHSDSKTPSLTVKMDNLETWYCFGCQKHGDIFDWLQLRQGLTFRQAVDKLGNWTPTMAPPAPAPPKPDGKQLLAAFRQSRVWERYQANMTPKLWAYLRQEWGIPQPIGELHGIGYCPSYGHYGSTFTIPFFYGRHLRCRVVKHRILGTEDSGGKYRYEPHEQDQCLYLTQPDKPWNGDIIAVEGEFKAIVLNQTLADPSTVIVGMPGMTPGANVRRQLRIARHVLLVMDPDVAESPEKRQAVAKLVRDIGRDKTSILLPPAKVDDLLLATRATASDARRLLGQAVRV